MNWTRLTLNALALLAIPVAFATTARADGARSYVSASGSDSKQCTRTQPCRSFDGALAKTDEGGEIVALDSGTYEATTVTKSITLAATPGADVSITVASGNAITLNTGPGARVVLRGLRLTGPGAGVAGTRGIEAVGEANMSNLKVHMEGLIVGGFDRGIHFDLISGQLSVSDTVVRGNNYGLHLTVGGVERNGTAISGCRIENNFIGLFTRLNSTAVHDSVMSGNHAGIETHGQLEVSNSAITKNRDGIAVKSGVARIGNSTFTGNTVGVDIDPPGFVFSLGNNMFAGSEIADVSGPTGAFTTFTAK